MKQLLVLILALVSLSPSAQTLKKYPIGNSGCFLYNYCISQYKVDYSTDSSKVYTGECTVNGVTYGVICIKLRNTVQELDFAEKMMIDYIEHLKESFKIIRAVGYGKGHSLNKRSDTRGILDYWTDSAGDQWKIKSWTDGNFIGFMYAYSKSELPESRVNVFLDSFRLPGM